MSTTNATQTTELRTGGVMLEAVNPEAGNTADGIAVPEARKQEQSDKVNAAEPMPEPQNGGLIVDALNLGGGDTSDGITVPLTRKQEQSDKANATEPMPEPDNGGLIIEVR